MEKELTRVNALNERNRLKAQLESTKKKQEIIKANIKDWLEFSTKPRTEEEIRERILKDKENNTETCCVSYICTFSKLSESFIEELTEITKYPNIKTRLYRDKVDWAAISSRQKLSEMFIEKHKDDVVWPLIFQYQELSIEFKKKHRHRMSLSTRTVFDNKNKDL